MTYDKFLLFKGKTTIFLNINVSRVVENILVFLMKVFTLNVLFFVIAKLSL